MHQLIIYLKLMNQSYKTYKCKVFQDHFNTIIQVQAISIFIVKIKLKVMKTNLVDALWRKKL